MEDELFTFKNTKKLTFGRGAAVDGRKATLTRDSSSSSDDEGQGRKRQGARRTNPGKNIALDPRPNSPINLDDSDIPCVQVSLAYSYHAQPHGYFPLQ